MRRRGAVVLIAGLGLLCAGGTAQAHTGDALETITCPATGTVATLLPVLSTLETVGCAASALDVEIITRFRRPDGSTLTRRHDTLVNVPAAVNADGDLLPDLVVTAQALSLSQFSLRVDRAVGEASPLPVSVEIVVDDPTNGGLPRERIHLGYDARASRAPMTYRAEIALADAPQVRVASIVTPMTPLDSLTVLGGLFDGDALSRQRPLGGRLGYAPVPSNSSVALTLGEGAKIDLTTAAPTVLTAAAELVDATSATKVDARIDRLPSTLSLAYAPGATENQRTIELDGASRIGKLDATFRQFAGGTQTLGALVKASGVPTSVTVAQTGARAGTIDTNGAFDRVEGAFATNGDPALGSAAGPYVKMLETGTGVSFAAALEGLKRASVDATGAISGDIELTPAGRKPLTVDIDRPGFTADGVIDSLPEHLTFTADLAAQDIHVDGHGQGIDALQLKAHSDLPFSGRITDLFANATDLPAAFDLDIDEVEVRLPPGSTNVIETGIEVTATPPLPFVEVSATDGGVTLPAGDGAGVTVIDTPATFAAGGRVFDFAHMRMTETKAGFTKLGATVRPGPFGLRYQDAEQTVTGSVTDLPGTIDLAIKPPAAGVPGRLDLNASDGIGAITATVDRVTPFIERDGPDPDRLTARVEEIPAQLGVDIETTANGALMKADQAIGAIEAQLTTGEDERLAPGESGLLLRDLPDRFVVFSRLEHVTELGGNSQPLKLHLRTTEPQRFVIDGQLARDGDAVDGVGTITGAIEDLPSELNVEQGPGGLSYDANAPIARFDLDATRLPGDSLDGELHELRVHLTDVPARFRVRQGSQIGIEALDGAKFGVISVEAWDHGPAFPPPLDSRTTAKLRMQGERFHAQIRTQDLQKAQFFPLLQTVDVIYGVDQPQELLADMEIDDIAVMGLVKQPPRELSLDLTSAGETAIEYTANIGFPEIVLRFSVAGATAGELNILNLPRRLKFCVAPGSNFGCDRRRTLFFEHGGNPYSLPPVIATYLETTDATGPVDASGTICLPPNQAVELDENMLPLPPDPWDEQACFSGERIHFLTFSHAKVRDFRFEFAGGDAEQVDEDGDPIENDMAQIWLDTSGLLLDNLEYRANNLEDPEDPKSYVFNSLGPDPFTAEDFEILIDSTPAIPEIDYLAGDIDCGSDSKLDPNAGFDVLDLAGPLIGC